MKRRVLLLGSTGLLGSKVSAVLAENRQIELITTSRNEDTSSLRFNPILNNLESLLDKTCPDYVVNCIGVIPQGRERTIKDYVEMFQINTLFARRLAQTAKMREITVIQPQTDAVFWGRRGGYSENSTKCPTSMYAFSKMLSETKLANQLNLRCSIIGPELSGKTKSIFSWCLSNPKGSEILGFTNLWWNGVTTLVFARICEYLIISNSIIPSTLHIVPSDSVNKFELLQLIAKYNSRSDLKISPCVKRKSRDLRLTSVYESSNTLLWQSIGFTSAPTIAEMLALN